MGATIREGICSGNGSGNAVMAIPRTRPALLSLAIPVLISLLFLRRRLWFTAGNQTRRWLVWPARREFSGGGLYGRLSKLALMGCYRADARRRRRHHRGPRAGHRAARDHQREPLALS